MRAGTSIDRERFADTGSAGELAHTDALCDSATRLADTIAALVVLR